MSTPSKLPATLIVVPANDPGLFEYLAVSLRPLPDVELIVDRRRAQAAESPAATGAATRLNRRTGRPPASAFRCLVIRRQPAAVEPEAAAAGGAADASAPTEEHRTLLWPALRLRDVAPEPSAGQAAAPRRPSPRPA